MSEEEAPVGGIRTAEGKAHPFRMPLNADEGELSVDDGLRNAVRRALNDGEPFAGV